VYRKQHDRYAFELTLSHNPALGRKMVTFWFKTGCHEITLPPKISIFRVLASLLVGGSIWKDAIGTTNSNKVDDNTSDHLTRALSLQTLLIRTKLPFRFLLVSCHCSFLCTMMLFIQAEQDQSQFHEVLLSEDIETRSCWNSFKLSILGLDWLDLIEAPRTCVEDCARAVTSSSVRLFWIA
jgi:hypothetical protein